MLQRGDDAVAAERGDEPGDTRIGDPPVGGLGREHVQVGPGPRDPRVQGGARGDDPCGSVGPAVFRPRPAVRPGRRRVALDGGDRQADLGGAAGRDDEPVLGEAGAHLLGRRIEPKRCAPEDIVESAVRQPHRPGLDDRREELAAPPAHHPPHLKDVGEVREVAPAQQQLVRGGAKALRAEHLGQLRRSDPPT